MSTIIHSLRGQMSTLLYEIGGKCPPLQFLGRGQSPRGQISGSLAWQQANKIRHRG